MDIQTVKKVARLARLDVKDSEKQPVADKMTQIMKWIEQLGEVNTDNIEPLTGSADMELHLRKDDVTDGACADKVLANAPEENQGYFAVPKVVE